MKFFSRALPLCIVLENGIRENRLAGVPGRPTIYMKFEDGQLIVDDPEIIEKLKKHKAFNREFWASDVDPLGAERKSSEPIHKITEIEHGATKKSIVSGKTDAEKAVLSKATEIAKVMAAEIIKGLVDSGSLVKPSSALVVNNQPDIDSSATASTTTVKSDYKSPKIYEYHGRETTLRALAEELGLKTSNLTAFIMRGNTIEQAVEKALEKKRNET